MRSIPHVPACTPLYDVLRIMQNMRCHMVVRCLPTTQMLRARDIKKMIVSMTCERQYSMTKVAGS